MASPPRTREEERRLNARTLAIASAASASAAAVTSQLWIAGTWIAAAVTPLIVALVSELLHRPTERIARAITSDRPALVLDDAEEAAAPAAHPDPGRPAARRPCACTASRAPAPSRRRIAVRVVVLDHGPGAADRRAPRSPPPSCSPGSRSAGATARPRSWAASRASKSSEHGGAAPRRRPAGHDADADAPRPPRSSRRSRSRCPRRPPRRPPRPRPRPRRETAP